MSLFQAPSSKIEDGGAPRRRFISIRLTCSGVSCKSSLGTGLGGGVQGRVLGPASDMALNPRVYRSMKQREKYTQGKHKGRGVVELAESSGRLSESVASHFARVVIEEMRALLSRCLSAP